jgi:hypothetical protein
MKIVLPSVLLFFFVFLTLILLIGSDPISAQIANVTDANFAEFYLNPDNYIDSDVTMTGKIFNLIPSSGNTGSFQIYQGGDSSRNVIISYEISQQLGPFSEDDCVRIVGTSAGSHQYANAFGGEVSAPFVDASSITKIECSDVISPAQKSIIVEESQTKSGIKVTLHKVEFSDKNTRVYLTIENNNKNTEISFYDFNSKAIQGNRQFETTTDYEVDYPQIQSDIPAGIVEDGVILFKPLSIDKGNMKLQFETSKNYQDVNFVFNIDPSAQSQQEIEKANPNTTTGQETEKANPNTTTEQEIEKANPNTTTEQETEKANPNTTTEQETEKANPNTTTFPETSKFCDTAKTQLAKELCDKLLN